MANDRLEQRPVARPRAARVLEHAVRELVLERGDALRTRARRGLVVHQGAPVVARALVGVGEPRVHVGRLGRIRLAREELLAAVDDRLVRHGVVPPRLPGARQHADHVDDAERLGRLHAGRAELGRVVDGGPAVHAPAEKHVAQGLAPVAVLGLVDRGEPVEVGAREQARDVAADRRTVIARHVGERVARRVVMTREVAADGEHVARRGGEPASLVPLDEGARRGDHAARRAGRRRDQQRPVVFELGDARERRVVDRPAPGLVARGAARALLVGACEDAFGLAGAAVEATGVEEVEGGMVQVVGLERALSGGDGLLA